MCYSGAQFCCFGLGCLNKLSFEVSAEKVPFSILLSPQGGRLFL